MGASKLNMGKFLTNHNILFIHLLSIPKSRVKSNYIELRREKSLSSRCKAHKMKYNFPNRAARDTGNACGDICLHMAIGNKFLSPFQ